MTNVRFISKKVFPYYIVFLPIMPLVACPNRGYTPTSTVCARGNKQSLCPVYQKPRVNIFFTRQLHCSPGMGDGEEVTASWLVTTRGRRHTHTSAIYLYRRMAFHQCTHAQCWHLIKTRRESTTYRAISPASDNSTREHVLRTLTFGLCFLRSG